MPEAKCNMRQYSNLAANKRDQKERLAICDRVPECEHILTQWEKERIETNKEEAMRRKEMKKRMDESRGKAAEIQEHRRAELAKAEEERRREREEADDEESKQFWENLTTTTTSKRRTTKNLSSFGKT